jgi:ABC-2 type transport system permease protein
VNLLNILQKEVRMSFSKEFVYKKQLLGWIIADTVKVTTLCFVWSAASVSREDISTGYVVSYYLLLMLVSKLTTDYTIESGVRDMVTGKFSNLLTKPFNYLIEYVGKDIGNNLLRFMLFLPAFIVGVIFASLNNWWIYDFNPLYLLLFLLSAIIAFLISFILGNTVSLVALRIKQMDSIRIFFYNTSAILSGEVIPIVFLPLLVQKIFNVLPFRYTLSFPVEILLGKLDPVSILYGFVVSILWLLILFIIYKFTYRYFIKYYEAEGI